MNKIWLSSVKGAVPLPITDSMTLGLVTKVRSQGHESRKKHTKMFGKFHLPDRMYYIPACLDQDPDLTWDQDDFLRETTTTNSKPITDKL